MCSDSTCNEQVKTNVCGNFDGSSANVTLFSSRKILLFWKVFGWLRDIYILTKVCSFVSQKILTQTRYFVIWSNKIICRTLKQTTKWDIGPVEAKYLMHTREKCCELFALKFGSFVHKNASVLFVDRASSFIICRLTRFCLWFPYLRA